ncbi:MAG: sulfurtransferase TusA family protein [bacterium]
MLMVISSRLDCRGLYDPWPIFLIKRTLDRMCHGDILEMVSDDPASEADMKAWAKLTGNNLLDYYCCDKVYRFYIQKQNVGENHGRSRDC